MEIKDIFLKNYRTGFDYQHIPEFEEFRMGEVLEFMKLAYNQAINDASENVRLYWTDLEQTEQEIDSESILKLKKL